MAESDRVTELLETLVAGQARLEKGLATVESGMAKLEAGQAKLENRLSLVEAEQTRLRRDILDQMERLLNEMSGVKDDMSVVISRVDRVDSSARIVTDELRAIHRQYLRLVPRIDALEDKGQAPH